MTQAIFLGHLFEIGGHNFFIVPIHPSQVIEPLWSKAPCSQKVSKLMVVIFANRTQG